MFINQVIIMCEFSLVQVHTGDAVSGYSGVQDGGANVSGWVAKLYARANGLLAWLGRSGGFTGLRNITRERARLDLLFLSGQRSSALAI